MARKGSALERQMIQLAEIIARDAVSAESSQADRIEALKILTQFQVGMARAGRGDDKDEDGAVNFGAMKARLKSVG